MFTFLTKFALVNYHCSVQGVPGPRGEKGERGPSGPQVNIHQWLKRRCSHKRLNILKRKP